MNRNREFFQLESPTINPSVKNKHVLGEKQSSQNSENGSEGITISPPSNDSSKALFKIELDDIGDKENVYLLLDYGHTNKKNFYSCSTEYMPGLILKKQAVI